jgi:hypothetical protein
MENITIEGDSLMEELQWRFQSESADVPDGYFQSLALQYYPGSLQELLVKPWPWVWAGGSWVGLPGRPKPATLD